MKFDLLKARLSGPGGNATGAAGLTVQKAKNTSNVDAASVLMDPLDFYQVGNLESPPTCIILKLSNLHKSVLRIRIVHTPFLQYPRDSESYKRSS